MKKRISYECLLVNGPVKEKVKYKIIESRYISFFLIYQC